MLETLATLGYNKQLLATPQLRGDTGNTELQLATQQHIGGGATLGYNRQLLATQVVLERLATLG